MRVLFVFLFLLGIVSCRQQPTQEEMRKTVKYHRNVKFCAESEGVDLLSLTDSEGINIREYYRPLRNSGWTEDSIEIRKNNWILGRTEGFDFGANRRDIYGTTGILGYKTNNQIARLYSDSKPFTGKAKLCVDSVMVSAMSYPSIVDYWIKKKTVVWEEMDVFDGWIDGEFIQYSYFLADDWKTVSSSKEVKKFKKGARHELFEEKNNDGSIFYKGSFENGLKEGFWIECDDEGEYLNGDKIGVWVRKPNYEGKKYVDSIYYENGEKVDLKTYLNGKEVK